MTKKCLEIVVKWPLVRLLILGHPLSVGIHIIVEYSIPLTSFPGKPQILGLGMFDSMISNFYPLAYMVLSRIQNSFQINLDD